VNALIEARGLRLHAADRCLLDHLDWQVSIGERWCVIGRNAAGKSTLLRALAGLSVPARAGELHWLGRPQHAWPAPDAATLRAFAPQQPSDRFPIRVERLLALSVAAPSRHTIGGTLGALDAAPLALRPVTQLSGGERQRIALAQCVLQGAPLMLMDEPVAFQDPAHQVQVAHWLRSLSDAALVITAHDVNWIALAATHVLALHGDGSHSQGSVGEMLNASTLARVYGCGWRQVGELWVAEI
jgi:iron complex transport system ATP-binding protein